jgi:hypothetical protein
MQRHTLALALYAICFVQSHCSAAIRNETSLVSVCSCLPVAALEHFGICPGNDLIQVLHLPPRSWHHIRGSLALALALATTL